MVGGVINSTSIHINFEVLNSWAIIVLATYMAGDGRNGSDSKYIKL